MRLSSFMHKYVQPYATKIYTLVSSICTLLICIPTPAIEIVASFTLNFIFGFLVHRLVLVFFYKFEVFLSDSNAIPLSYGPLYSGTLGTEYSWWNWYQPTRHLYSADRNVVVFVIFLSQINNIVLLFDIWNTEIRSTKDNKVGMLTLKSFT